MTDPRNLGAEFDEQALNEVIDRLAATRNPARARVANQVARRALGAFEAARADHQLTELEYAHHCGYLAEALRILLAAHDGQ